MARDGCWDFFTRHTSLSLKRLRCSSRCSTMNNMSCKRDGVTIKSSVVALLLDLGCDLLAPKTLFLDKPHAPEANSSDEQIDKGCTSLAESSRSRDPVLHSCSLTIRCDYRTQPPDGTTSTKASTTGSQRQSLRSRISLILGFLWKTFSWSNTYQ